MEAILQMQAASAHSFVLLWLLPVHVLLYLRKSPALSYPYKAPDFFRQQFPPLFHV